MTGSNSRRLGADVQVTIWNGDWGDWLTWDIHDFEYYACGVTVYSEPPQGSNKDDIGIGGIRIYYCDRANWNDMESDIPSSWNPDFRSKAIWVRRFCPYGKYIGRVRVRYESPQGAFDDTAINGMEVECHDITGQNWQRVMIHSGYWGGWTPWRGYHSKHVIGANIRFEFMKSGADNTGLNGLKLLYEDIDGDFIRNRRIGKNIDLHNYVTTNRQPILLWEPNFSNDKGIAQRWIKALDGTIRSEININKCLEAGKAGKLYAKAYIYDCHGGAWQKWDFLPDGRIRNRYHKKYLGISYCGDRFSLAVSTGNTLYRALELRNFDSSGECAEAQKWYWRSW